MKILALDFSSARRSVALLESRALSEGQGLWWTAEPDGTQHGGLVLVEEVLAQAKVKPDEVECLAIGLGPGSYTGIRAAISLGQGWQLAHSVKLLGVSSVECLAGQLHAAKLFGPTNIAVDAQRGEFYVAGYEVSPTGPRLVEPLHLASLAEVASRQAAGQRLVGPGLTQFFPGASAMDPDAKMLAQLALGRSNFVGGEELEPIYLRETSFVKASAPAPKWMERR